LDQRRKATEVVCWVCHLAEANELHPCLPSEGEYAVTEQEKQVEDWAIPELTVCGNDVTRRKKHTSRFKYTAAHGNSSLKDHINRYHKQLHSQFVSVLSVRPSQLVFTKRRQPPPPLSPLEALSTNNDESRPLKRPKTDEEKADTLASLLALLLVFARLPFSLLANTMFKAFVWFLDPVVPIPTRAQVSLPISAPASFFPPVFLAPFQTLAPTPNRRAISVRCR
jgi:hypothetical protein